MAHCREAVNVLYSLTTRPYVVISTLYSQLAQSVQSAFDDYRDALARPARQTDYSVPATNPREMNGYGRQPNGEDNDAMSDDLDSGRGSGDVAEPVAAESLETVKSKWELSASRLLFFVGELALKFIIYLEVGAHWFDLID